MNKTVFLFLVITTTFSKSSTSVSQENSKNLKAIPVEKLIQVYSAKCVRPGVEPKSDCYLTERDMDDSGDPTQMLIFRGEEKIFSTPANSSYKRWANSDLGICSIRCDDKMLSDYFLLAIKDFSHYLADTIFFDKKDMSWRDKNNNQVQYSDSEIFSDLAASPLEVVLMTHLRINHFLSFENAKKSYFDPFVSFSTNPGVAATFAGVDGNKSGVIWVARMPIQTLKVTPKNACSKMQVQIGALYDVSACHILLSNDKESEVDIFMYLPSNYLYGQILGDDIRILDSAQLW